MRRTIPCAGLILVCIGAWTVALAADEDPWVGKTRADVVLLLGEPNKVKQSRSSAETLVFKLVRLDEAAVPPPGVRVLNVPGVGVVGQIPKPGAMKDPGVGIGPTEMDRKGRATGGGVGTDEDLSMEWNSDTKEVTHSWEDQPAIRGKLTLKFEVDASGTIEHWSVSPKKAASGS